MSQKTRIDYRVHIKPIPVGEWPPMGFAFSKTMTKAEMLETYPSQPTGLRRYLETGEKSPAFTGKITIPAADEILAHKRALKAAQMRRYRAKKAGK